jgi:hypothetical protein
MDIITAVNADTEVLIRVHLRLSAVLKMHNLEHATVIK